MLKHFQLSSKGFAAGREYNLDSIQQEKQRRLHSLEQDLIAAAKGPKIEVAVSRIRKKGLVAALRARAVSRERS
jgi:hypothetical protein